MRLAILPLLFLGPLSLAAACSSNDDGGSTGIPDAGGGAGATAGTTGAVSGSSGQGAGGTGTSGKSGAGTSGGGTSGGGTSGGGTSGGAAGAAGGASGGAAGGGQGGAVDVVGGSTGLSGASGGSGGPPVDDPSPICKQNQPWSPNPLTNQAILPSGANGAIKEQRTLSALSGDSLTIAWTTQDKVFYADRASLTSNVQQYQQLPSSLEGAGYPLVEKVALSGDGLRLLMVSLDRTRLGELSRTATGQPFGDAINENPFAAVIKARQSDEQIADPVLVSDDTALYLSFYKNDSSRLVVSHRAKAGDAWGTPVTLDEPLLASSAGAMRKRLWWVSKDQLTVFLYDPNAQSSQAIWRKNVTKAFDSSLTVGDVRAPFSDDKCVQLTYSALNSMSVLDVFFVKKI